MRKSLCFVRAVRSVLLPGLRRYKLGRLGLSRVVWDFGVGDSISYYSCPKNEVVASFYYFS
jgi:hypothetical protein